MPNKTHGGARPGAGRKKQTTEKRTVNRSVTLTGEQWQALEELGKGQTPPVSATKMAARILQSQLNTAAQDNK